MNKFIFTSEKQKHTKTAVFRAKGFYHRLYVAKHIFAQRAYFLSISHKKQVILHITKDIFAVIFWFFYQKRRILSKFLGSLSRNKAFYPFFCFMNNVKYRTINIGLQPYLMTYIYEDK